jgi:hypothetical protein
VCESEKGKNETVKGIRGVGCGKLWGVNPLGPQKIFLPRQTHANSVALWSSHANSANFAIGVRLQDQFFKVFHFCCKCICTTTICNNHKNTYKTGCASQQELVLRP